MVTGNKIEKFKDAPNKQIVNAKQSVTVSSAINLDTADVRTEKFCSQFEVLLPSKTAICICYETHVIVGQQLLLRVRLEQKLNLALIET